MGKIDLIAVKGVRVYKTKVSTEEKYAHLAKLNGGFEYHYDLDVVEDLSGDKNIPPHLAFAGMSGNKTLLYSDKTHRASFDIIDAYVKEHLKELDEEQRKVVFDIPAETEMSADYQAPYIKFKKPIQLMGYFVNYKLADGTFLETEKKGGKKLRSSMQLICIGRRPNEDEDFEGTGETPQSVFESLRDAVDDRGENRLRIVNERGELINGSNSNSAVSAFLSDADSDAPADNADDDDVVN